MFRAKENARWNSVLLVVDLLCKYKLLSRQPKQCCQFHRFFQQYIMVSGSRQHIRYVAWVPTDRFAYLSVRQASNASYVVHSGLQVFVQSHF
jgi:hypothetical protein